jgi:hypothetical protein
VLSIDLGFLNVERLSMNEVGWRRRRRGGGGGGGVVKILQRGSSQT